MDADRYDPLDEQTARRMSTAHPQALLGPGFRQIDIRFAQGPHEDLPRTKQRESAV